MLLDLVVPSSEEKNITQEPLGASLGCTYKR